jgi:ABC-2 type transport system ATP-binding protein
MSALVVVKNLQKRYGAVTALRGISFEISAGEIFGLLGPNGAGKTSTLECVTSLREADAGEISISGIDVRREPRAAREKIGVALQATSLQDKITPREALRLFGSFYATADSPAVLLERFQLSDKADVAFDTLSGGQRQRLALALAFVNCPDLVLLDEPTAGLDPQGRRELHEEIRRMKAAGHTVLLTTHYLEEAEELCDRVAIIDRGTILAIGHPRELIAQSSSFQSVTLETNVALRAELLERWAEIRDVDADGVTLRFRTAAVKPAIAKLMALLETESIELVSLSVRKATLEDIFLGLTTDKERATLKKGPAV